MIDNSSPLALLPYEFARLNRVLVRPDQAEILHTSTIENWVISEISRCNNVNLSLVEVNDELFDKLLSDLYQNQQSSSEVVMAGIKDFVDLEEAAAALEESVDLLDSENDAPIIRLLNSILAEALKEHASDVHIEPYEKQAVVRFRLDGVLRTVLNPSVQIAPLLISRIKVMSRLDIAEKRLPQDGRMAVKLGGRSIDLRVSTMPSSYGERVVMRLLDRDAGKMQTEDLGMPAETKARLEKLIQRPHGIILVTGPTGSGKTTTLYAALQQMNRQERNIMTIEDPVEYDLPGISQTQINIRAGMTFAKGLRAILRQDPDVILIGEIRDKETAEIATQASLTGHLVLSTLHTNTASGAITRLQDIGIDSFLLASTIRGIVAQRLLRKLCQHCREEKACDEYQSKLLGMEQGTSIYQAVGCEQCNNTGFDGRQALFELVEIDTELQSLIHENAGEIVLEAAVRRKTPSIKEAGLEQVKLGTTTIEEVLRVTSL
ncbi:MAG: type II secretion system protein GspE [SAR86 cluster bacterium]|uniref:Type II secretion system protein E n=1 Tax=SAR86 cluster bacterium TaxID=2030880 RepID=A0A2A5CGZ5_9GAMM|nr:MAG: type II secretion system protein GspE [SAR86 cluster bacterium]